MKYPWEPCFVTARTESYTYETRWGSAVKPSEVHALLKLQNPFHSLLVKLPGVWAGPMSPPARVSSCCFPAHPVHGAVAQAGFAAAGLAWLKVSAAPVLSLAMPHHSCADTFSLWLGCLCSRGLPWFEARGSHKYQPRREHGWVQVSAPACRNDQQSLQGQEKVWGLQCLLLLWIRTLRLETGQRCIDEKSMKAGEKDTFHTGELWFESRQELCLK